VPSPSAQVLGVYQVEVTSQLLAEALELKYENRFSSSAHRREAETRVREELGGVVLIEVLIHGRDASFDPGEFRQDNSDQAPYDEVYLTEDGTTVISRGYDVPAVPSFRVAFFLHYFHPKLPLRSCYGAVAVPVVQSMPPRLAALLPYEPVT
jgi:hypothetical protein